MRTDEYLSNLEFHDLGGHWQDENGEPHQSGLGKAPILSAEREVESRIERLNQVWGHAQATARALSNKYQRLWDGAIIKLADHKGTLLVTWRDELSRFMFEGVILGAWEANGEHAHVHGLSEQIGRGV